MTSTIAIWIGTASKPDITSWGSKCGGFRFRDFVGPDVQRTLSECVAALDELLRAGHTVYIHCKLGAVRSPTVVVAYLVQGRGWELEDAIEYVTRVCSCSPPSTQLSQRVVIGWRHSRSIMLATPRSRRHICYSEKVLFHPLCGEG